MIGIWMALAPASFGGQSSFIIVAGASMEPALSRGDLVLATREASYHVGDIVAYQHPQVGPVIHRIVGRQGPLYTLQGDNNSWLDSYTPDDEAILGRAWLTVPHVGAWLGRLQSPVALGLLSLLIGTIVASTLLTHNTGAGMARGAKVRKSWGFATRAPNLDWAVYAITLVAGISVILGLFAFTRPTSSIVPSDIPFQHTGEFSYAAAASGAVYPGGEIHTGDPIYDALAPAFDVGFRYAFEAPSASAMGGHYRLYLEIREPKGWHRALAISPEVPFTGSEFKTVGTVSMPTVRMVLENLETATGFDREIYDIDIVADVFVSGVVGDVPIESPFQPRLSFTLDDFQLSLKPPDPLAEGADPVRPVLSGYVERFETGTTMLPILGAELPVPAARSIAVAGLALSVAAAGIVFLPLVRARRQGGVEAIRATFSGMLITASDDAPSPSERPIDLEAFEDLARLATQHGQFILHVPGHGRDIFLLHIGESTYRFTQKDDSAVLEDPNPPRARKKKPRRK